MTDAQLLNRFLTEQDQAAFEQILRRHAPAVSRICRSILFDPHEVEDAFQATFAVLVRNGAAIRERDSLGPWLYEVAYRVSTRARSRFLRRRSQTGTVAESTLADPSWNNDRPGEPERRELVALLRDEVSRLPRNHRDAIVACYLEGRTHEDAARGLGLPLGTFKGRLRQGRALLRSRLERRGVAAPLALFLVLEWRFGASVDAAPIIDEGSIEASTRTAHPISGPRSPMSRFRGRPVRVAAMLAAVVVGTTSVLVLEPEASKAVQRLVDARPENVRLRRIKRFCDELENDPVEPVRVMVTTRNSAPSAIDPNR
ncbi:MAG: RNA polymerase sigma factor [Isosphaeraceae bacterium]|nr:RNA polymerase sigma factor [Isosphaeraceae bacterium]